MIRLKPACQKVRYILQAQKLLKQVKNLLLIFGCVYQHLFSDCNTAVWSLFQRLVKRIVIKNSKSPTSLYDASSPFCSVRSGSSPVHEGNFKFPLVLISSNHPLVLSRPPSPLTGLLTVMIKREPSPSTCACGFTLRLPTSSPPLCICGGRLLG